MHGCNAYATKVKEEIERGNLEGFSADNMRASDLFETVPVDYEPVDTKHIAYKVIALSEFPYDTRASMAFTDTFDAKPKSRGLSDPIDRGKDVSMNGLQYMAGVHGSGQGGGPTNAGAAMPHCWQPHGTEDPKMTSLMLAHVHAVEDALVMRSWIAAQRKWCTLGIWSRRRHARVGVHPHAARHHHLPPSPPPSRTSPDRTRTTSSHRASASGQRSCSSACRASTSGRSTRARTPGMARLIPSCRRGTKTRASKGA